MKKIRILPQPNDLTCGPTCLHAIYDFYNDPIGLDQVITEVRSLKEGGTLDVYLAIHALERGYEVTLNVINPEIFDPSWFATKCNLRDKLYQQSLSSSGKLKEASDAFIEFIDKGGKLISRDISSRLLKEAFSRSLPILAGLSATYLYRCPRERMEGLLSLYDDIRGVPSGHFVVLNGYEQRDAKNIIVADPYSRNPLSGEQIHYYKVRVSRLINAIMLGALTYDANLLFIRRSKKRFP